MDDNFEVISEAQPANSEIASLSQPKQNSKAVLPTSQSDLAPPISQPQTTGYQRLGKKLSSMTSSLTSECPLRSFTTLNIIVLWGLYLPMLILSAATKNPYECIVFNFGGMYPPAVNGAHNFQYYRYLTSIFLTTGFLQLLNVTIFLTICSYPLENFYGRWRFLFFYLMSGIGGHIISQFFLQKAITVGVPQCIFGMIPLVIGYVFENANAGFKRKVIMIASVVLIVFVQYVSDSQYDQMKFYFLTDHSSKLGGLTTGLLMSVIYTKFKFSNWEKIQVGAKVMLPFILFSFFIYNQIANFNGDGSLWMCKWM